MRPCSVNICNTTGNAAKRSKILQNSRQLLVRENNELIIILKIFEITPSCYPNSIMGVLELNVFLSQQMVYRLNESETTKFLKQFESYWDFNFWVKT